MRQIDLAGQRFGRLVALTPTAERRHANVIWQCVCDCGTEKKIVSADLRSGKARSCGCLRRDLTIEQNKLGRRPPIARGPCDAPGGCEKIAWAGTLCRSHYMRAWNAKQPANWQRPAQMRAKYGLTAEAFAALAEGQGGVCAICKQPPNRRGLFVDHDHSCCPGQRTCGSCLRGLLCSNCNFLIGLAKEDRKVLHSAVDYLEVWTTS